MKRIRADPAPPAALRSGLVPRHSALRAPDVRAALARQHSLHASIFSGSTGSRQTEQLRCDARLGQDPGCQYAVTFEQHLGAQTQLIVTRSMDWPRWPPRPQFDQTPSWHRALPLPTSPVNTPRTAWAPGSSHLAFCLQDTQLGSQSCVLHVMRIDNGAHRAYVLETAGPWQDLQPHMLDLLWAPTAPSGRPRLAVVSTTEACPWLCAPMCATSQQLACPQSPSLAAAGRVHASTACCSAADARAPPAGCAALPEALLPQERRCAPPASARSSAGHCAPALTSAGTAACDGDAQALACGLPACMRPGGSQALQRVINSAAPAPRPPAHAGCEVIYQRCTGIMATICAWSPDAESLAIVSQGGRRDFMDQRQLVLRHSLSGGHHVHCLDSPVADLLFPCNVAFGASGKYVLALGDLRAAFVDVAIGAVQLQPKAVPATGECVAVVCGSAGYVAVAYMHHHGGSVSVLLAAGSPVRLQLLHQIPTWKVVTQLSFADSGLLCCWAEIDPLAPEGLWSEREEGGGMDVSGPAKTLCCEAATGRHTVLARQQLCSAFMAPVPRSCQGVTARFEPGFGLGACSSMLISGPAQPSRVPAPAGQQLPPDLSLVRCTFGT